MVAEAFVDLDYQDVWARIDSVLAIMQSLDGTAGGGLPIRFTDYAGTDWNLDVESVDTTAGQTLRAQSGGVIHIQADKNGLTSNLPVTFGSTLNVVGNFSVNTNKFTVTASSGNTAVAGTLAVTGATTLSSTLGVTGDVTVGASKVVITAASGNTAIAGTLGVTGDVTIGASKVVITASSGNTAIVGTLGVTGATSLGSTLAVTGNVTVNTNKVVITATSGNVAIAGDLAINSDKFVVTASTGGHVLKSHITMANNTALQMLTTGAVTRDIVTFTSGNVIVLGNSNHEVRFDGTRHGFFGVTPVTKRSIGGAAVDAATTLTLANNIRTALIDLGLCQT